MKDPNLIAMTDRIPDDWRRMYMARPLEKLPADVTRAFDALAALQREKDRMQAEMLATKRWSYLRFLLLLILGAMKILADHWK